MFVARNTMLFFLCYFVIVTSAFPEDHIDSENVSVSAEDGAGGRIAGGEDPDRGARAAPFQAQITREGATFCSGTIINERYILTAAHCVEGAKPQELIVRVGTNIRGQGMVVPIEKIVQHPDYDYPQNNFDIAYMRTAEDIPLLPFVTSLRAAFIDGSNASVPNELHVTGWGYQEDNQRKLADSIRAVDLPVISNVECQVFYPMMSITKNMICGYSLRDTDKGTCVGDGGDPATVGLRLVGVNSATRGCGPGMGPSVFTYVDAKEIRNFILNGTSGNGAQQPGHPVKGPEKHPDEYPESGSDVYDDKLPEDTSQRPADYSDFDQQRPENTSQRPANYSDYDEQSPETTSQPPANYSDYDEQRPENTSQRPANYSDYDEQSPETTSQPPANYSDYDEQRPENTSQRPANYSDYDEQRPENTSQRPANYSDYDVKRPENTSQRPADYSDYDEQRPENTEHRPSDYSYYDVKSPGDTSKHPTDVPDYPEEHSSAYTADPPEGLSKGPQRQPADRPQKRPAEREP